jgi:hypothetical protein
MHSEVIEALVAMGQYAGTLKAFIRESATMVHVTLNCSPEEAERTLQDLRDSGQIDLAITPGGELPPPPAQIPIARWYWFIPAAA